MMDHIMKAMEKYADNLENTVRERTQQLAEEKKRCDQLLYRLLPQYCSFIYPLLRYCT